MVRGRTVVWMGKKIDGGLDGSEDGWTDVRLNADSTDGLMIESIYWVMVMDRGCWWIVQVT